MYSVELMPKAIKDLKKLPQPDAVKIAAQIQSLENGLTGDVKIDQFHTGIPITDRKISGTL